MYTHCFTMNYYIPTNDQIMNIEIWIKFFLDYKTHQKLFESFV